MRRRLLAVPVALAALLAVPAIAQAHPAPAHHRAEPVRFRFLGETELPHALQFDGTTVGGLSAISYDKRTGKYLIISDDRSAIDPSRFYTAAISAAPGSVSVRLTGTSPFRQPDGSTYPATSATAGTIAQDPEGIAVDPLHDRFAWSSEGERILSPLTLEDPAVHLATPSGTTIRDLPTAPEFHMNPQNVGPRQNQAFEGLSYTPDGRELFVGMEDPLLQDGADPTASAGARTRITQVDAATGVPVAQYAYPLQPLFEQGSGASYSTNGLSDLAALGGGRFLVLERGYSTGERYGIRVFEADAAHATDVIGRDTLAEAPVTAMSKRLVVDLGRVDGLPRVDNVEGIAIGPRLSDGGRLVVLVSDDNFSADEVTQFIAFEATGL